MRASIILPTYNERENLPKLLEALRGLQLPDWEAIVVDDASPDGTGQLADELARTFPVRVIHRSGKLGLSSAVVDGLRAGQGQSLVVMDADLSHDPVIIPQLLRHLEQGRELAVGSRFVTGGGMEGWPARRQFMSRVATLLAQALFRVPVRDPMSGYFAVRREFFERVAPKLHPRGYKILLELIVRGRPASFAEVGFIFRDRLYGKSKVTTTVIVAYLRMIFDLLRR